MNREKALLVLLILSLCGNIYLMVLIQEHPLAIEIRDSLRHAYFPEVPGDNSSLLDNATVSAASRMAMSAGDAGQGGGQVDVLPTDTPVPVQTPVATPTPEPTEAAALTGYTPGWEEYSNVYWRFAIPYPAYWEKKEGGGTSRPAVTFTAPPESECDPITTECYQYVAVLEVDVDGTPETIVLEEYFNKAVSRLQQEYGITATSKSAPTTLSGNKAYWIEYYTRDSRGNPSKNYMQYFTILDRKAYILTYSGPFSTSEGLYSRYKPDAQKMIDSFIVEREFKVI